MEIEYEVRRLNVSFDEIIQKIKSIGAKRVGVYHQKRYVYDFIPAQKGRWIRLRSNGKISTLTIKEIESVLIDGTKELEIEVSDFENTNEILMKLGYIPRNFQENFRIEYILDGVKFDLDKWPMIPAYLEIEGQSEKDILKVIKLLDWRIEDMSVQNVDKIYSEVYGINLDSKKKLEFNEKEIAFINKLSNL
jgi:adenylate cyclase class 2